jgi:hypothetical protein
MEGTKMRQLVFRSADIYCQKLNNLKCTLALFLYANRKKGKQANGKRDRERDCVSIAERWMLASVIKLAAGKTH